MNPEIIGLIGLAVFFICMFLSMPVGVTMALVGFIGFAVITDMKAALHMLAIVPYSTVASYVFSVLPVFMLMGELISSSTIMKDAYNSMNKILGNLPGGLSIAAIAGCAAFAAACGSSTATAVTMCRVSLPEMLEHKYQPSLATGAIAAGGTLGILIPPSLPLIIYALIAEQSVGELYMAGVVPGIALAFMFMLGIYVFVKVKPSMAPPNTTKYSIWQKLSSLKSIWGIALISGVILGGIWIGYFTPTEAGSIGAVGSFLLIILRKELTGKVLITSLMNTLKTVGMILVILIGAMIFNYFMSVSQLPTTISNWVNMLNLNGTYTVIIIALIYLLLGCFLDSGSMMLLTVPIFIPTLALLGVDLVWFGILVVVMTELALITPPVGMHCWIIHGIVKERGISMGTVFRGAAPFALIMILFVCILIAFPQIALYLPGTMTR